MGPATPATTALAPLRATVKPVLGKSLITVTLVLPWKDNPVPAVHVTSAALARMVRGEAVLVNAFELIKAVLVAKQLTEAKLVLWRNAALPMLVTLFGIVTLVN